MKWFYKNRYRLLKYILQSLREGLRIVILAMFYAFVVYSTCIMEKLPEEFIEKLLVGSFRDLGFVLLIGWIFYSTLGIIRLSVAENRAINIQGWIVNSIGLIGGSVCIGWMLKNRIADIISGRLFDTTLIAAALMLVLVDILRYWIKCIESKKRV